MTKAMSIGLLAALSTGAFAAQDAVTTLPGSYSTQFENAWVRVVRVHYAPHARLPAHTHNTLPAAYVYLNDSGPVLFRHIGASYGAATRPPTKAGGFRLFRGIDEVHEVENASDLPSDFLRVEFKTEPRDVRTLKGRFYREPAARGEPLVQFENEQVRITRVTCPPGRPVRLEAPPSEPALLIALPGERLREADAPRTVLRIGQESWLSAGGTLAVEGVGAEPGELLRFDFKTAPVTSSSNQR